nr:nucleotidyltransferase domain-containing protein [Rhodococcus sp. (in: high G+C Gram-positive bacteria)]
MTDTLLQGIVGSTAYGLATPDSDIDRLAVHAEPSNMLMGLYPLPEKRRTIVGTDPDIASHELGKAAHLWMKCNPTATEILWLDSYEYLNWAGQELLEIRKDFLSRRHVRNAYLGYASHQLKKLAHRGDDEVPKRIEKHARHILRLLHQGIELHRTGELSVRLEPDVADRMREMAIDIAARGDRGVALASDQVGHAIEAFDLYDTPLPEEPRQDRINELILTIRRGYWSE